MDVGVEEQTLLSVVHHDDASLSWTFNEFMESYNQLYASLNAVQDVVFSTSQSSRLIASHLNKELSLNSGRYTLFLDQSDRLAAEYPDLKEEVSCRVDLLTAKWRALNGRAQAVTKSKENPVSSEQDFEEDMYYLEKWLLEKEETIMPLRFHDKWTKEEIAEKMNEIKFIQQDVKSHGNIVKSVLRSRTGVESLRQAQRIEDRWHCVWLRSLEWQCFLEELAWRDHAEEPTREDTPFSIDCGIQQDDCAEPFNKIPKLIDCATSPKTTRHTAKAKKDNDLLPIVRNCEERKRKTKRENMTMNLNNGSDIDDILNKMTDQSEEDVPSPLQEFASITTRPSLDVPPNCATYFFEHEDSDLDIRRQLIAQAEKLVSERASNESLVGGKKKRKRRAVRKAKTSDSSCEASSEGTSSDEELSRTLMEEEVEAHRRRSYPDLVEASDVMTKSLPAIKFSDLSSDEKSAQKQDLFTNDQLSDFWDQENYLSEHHYDEAIDEDSALQLLNFGDDYRNFIDSMSDCISSVSEQEVPRRRRVRRQNAPGRCHSPDSMSESEVEDIRRVLGKSQTQYSTIGGRVKEVFAQAPDEDHVAELENLLRTCEENEKCLELLMEPIVSGNNYATLKKAERDLRSLLTQWRNLAENIKKRIKAIKTLDKLKKNIVDLEAVLEKILELPKLSREVQSPEDMLQLISNYKEAIVNLTSYKSDLFNINLGVHNFFAEQNSGSDGDAGLDDDLASELKDHVVRLYAQWDTTFHKISGCLEDTKSTLQKLSRLDDEAKKLINSIENDLEKKIKSEDSGISESGSSSCNCTDSEIAQKERILVKLRFLARELEQTLSPEASVLQEITSNLAHTTEELETLQRHKEHEPHQEKKESKKLSSPSPSIRSRSLFGRVLRAGVPIQVFLVVSWLLMLYLEPTCCDTSNTLNFTPQLRYVNGPPPI